MSGAEADRPGAAAVARPIRVLAVDDHPLMLEGVAGVLRGEPDLVLVGEATRGEEAVALFRRLRPDVTLMDLRLGGQPGHAIIAALVGEYPDACVLALTSYQGDADIARALRAGARGYLFKEVLRTELRTAIRRVHAGQRVIPPDVAARLAAQRGAAELTGREQEVLALLATGQRNAAIARALGLAAGTVKVHVERVLTKLGARDRTEAVALAVRRGLLHLD